MIARRRVPSTPDSHLFPTRDYDLVREFVLVLGVVLSLTVVLAAVFSSPDRKAITLRDWATADPNDVVATAAAELAGTSASASYGPPYNSASSGQQLGPLSLQKWAGRRLPVNSANDLVIAPLQAVPADPQLQTALVGWTTADPGQRTDWASRYADALVAADTPATVKPGNYGPVPLLTSRFEALARSGGLDGLLTRDAFYPTDQTRPLLLLSDGAYLEQQARAEHLGGDQWGMMNESGNYPGQPWLWLYTFWYQVPPFSSSGNADALVWGLMVLLTIVLLLLPYLPGLRSLPRYLGVHRLIWRDRR